MSMTKGLKIRLAASAALLAAGLLTMVAAARVGVVHLGAGEMRISMGGGDRGLTLDVAQRTCPPNCGFDVNWRPLAR
jgi:hypothetical protein